MIRALVSRFGRRTFPVQPYGPWEFGRHVTVYVGRRWSLFGIKRSWNGRSWFGNLPARVYVSRHRGRTHVVKIELGTLLVCWDRDVKYVTSRMWEADRVEVDR